MSVSNGKMDEYLLGILWGSATIHHSNLLIRNKDKYYIDYAVSALGGNIRIQNSRTGIQYTANLPLQFNALQKYGWTMRNDDMRPYPLNIDNSKRFCSAWIEMHHILDFCTIRGTKRNRLRIYGNYSLLSTMNQKISGIAKVRSKSLQLLHNGKTAVLYYQSYNEITNICKTFIHHRKLECEEC
jgi:hypothetical protein